MFTRKTVFVVGAGGSHELGLPLGSQLKDLIAEKVNIRFSNLANLANGDDRIAEALKLREHLSERKRNLNDIFAISRSISSALPQAISIDNYLHTRGTDDDRILIGKLAISLCILDAESKSTSLQIGFRDRERSFRFGNEWHNLFCQIATKGLHERDLETAFDNVSIVTFNYDRCIEQYVYEWMKNYFDLSDFDTARLTDRLNVEHVYGQVGYLPWQNGHAPQTAFGVVPSPNDLLLIANSLRTFTEGAQSEALTNRIHQKNNRGRARYIFRFFI